MLGKMCYDFSNGLKSAWAVEVRPILDWIGFTVDIAALTAFFSHKTFTILAVWENLNCQVRSRKHLAAFDVLLSVHLSIMDEAPWTTTGPQHDFAYFVEMAPNRVAILTKAYPCNQCELDDALRHAVIDKGPIELVSQLVNAGASLKNSNSRISADELIRYFGSRECETVDLALLKILLEAGAVVDEPVLHSSNLGWPRPDDPTYATDYMLLNEEQLKHNYELWSLVSAYSDRQQTTVTVPGIFRAAGEGQEQLNIYLNARSKPHDVRDRNEVLEIALSEAAERGYVDVVQSLVHFGVNPNVSTVRESHHIPFDVPHQKFRHPVASTIWHPFIRAVNAGQLDTLRCLVKVTSIDLALLDELVGTYAQLDLCALRNVEKSQRDQILQILSTLRLSTLIRRDIFLYTIRPHYDCGSNHVFPDFGFASQLLKHGFACLDKREDSDTGTAHILVRAITTGCRMSGLKYLVEQDVEVLSSLPKGTFAALLEATLRKWHNTRNEMLEFLAQNVEEFQTYVQNSGSCHLSNFLTWTESDQPVHNRQMCWEHDCKVMVTVEWFVSLGVPLESHILPGIMKYANDSFILSMIHSMTDVEELDICHALHQSIKLGRLNMAVALLESGLQVNGPQIWNGYTTLQQACANGAPLWFIRYLVDRGADVNAHPASEQGFTALQAACCFGAQLSCINFLLEKGADVNGPPASRGGWTALQCAAEQGMMNIAGLLLDHGADVNALSGPYPGDPADSRFIRAIDLAVMRSRLDMVYFLLAAGARSCEPGHTGFQGAITIATEQRNFAIASLLQEYADSGSQHAMEAERRWLGANPHVFLRSGSIESTVWAHQAGRAERAKQA